MSGLTFSVKLDTAQFTQRLDFAAKEAVQAIRAGVNAAAVDAKRAWKPAFVKDAGGTVRSADVTSKFAKSYRASASNLENKTVFIGKGFDRSPSILSDVKDAVTIGTFLQSGGGSANLSKPRFFILRANGGQIVLSRFASSAGARGAKGSRLSAAFVRKIHAETPAGSMRTGDAPRKVWETTANTAVAAQVASRIQTVLDGRQAPDAPSGDI
jgi:hypothetical protein